MTDFVLNTWYPLTWSRDVKRALISRRVAERDVVLYRTEGGNVVAMEDACPHRLLPLSMGKLKGDSIECGYHGMTFDCQGSCVRIPSQAAIPPSAKVRTYPTRENMRMVWIWLGNPSLAADTPVFDLPQYHDQNWSAMEGDALEIHTNYLNLADNLCDPAHVSFVHLSTLGTAAGEDIPVHHELQGKSTLTWRWILNSEPIPLFAKYGNFEGNVDRWHYYYYHAPSVAVIDFGSAEAGTGAPEGRRENCLQIFACHFITPVDKDRSIDHWMHVKNFHVEASIDAAMLADYRMAFSEDKVILEAISRNEASLPDRRKLLLGLDASAVRMRRIVKDMLDAERTVATD